MGKSKVTLSLIADIRSRRSTFNKRKRGFLKKLNELVTLCDVKACAVIANSQNDQNPEAWPSKEGAEEVYSKFMEFPEEERARNMYDQSAYTWERITKEHDKMKKLHDENREFELRDLMFDFLKGKMIMDYQYYDASVLQDLSCFIDRYVHELDHRIHTLEVSGESISFPPLDVAAVDATHPAVGDVNPAAVSDVAAVTTPLECFYHIPPYQNMNTNVNQQAPANFNDHIQYQNMNQQELAHYQVPTDFSDHAQYQNMNTNVNQQAPATFNDHIQYQNMNQQELAHYQVPTDFSDHAQYQNMNPQEQFQYQDPANVYDQNQHRFYGSTQDMSSDLNHNLRESSNQYLNQWMEQPPQMSYVEELANVPSMDDNYYRYHQLPTTSHMPSITTTTTTTTVDLSAPNTNNNPWPTRFGLE